MKRLLRKKTIELVGVLFAVSLLTFLLLSLVPGDSPAVRMLGDQATPESIAELEAELGLDDPLPVRYVSWLGDVFRGDLGRSIDLNQDVADVLVERLPVTLEIAALTIGIGALVAIPLAVLSAWREGSRIDNLITTASFAVLSLPSFLVAIILLIVFAVNWDLLPAAPAWVPITEAPLTNLKNLILPVSAMAIGEVAVLTRVLRIDLLEALRSDYIVAARAKGLTTRYVLVRHALPAALTSSLTLIGLQVAGAITGAVVIEQIFGLPGLGRTLLTAISRRDLVLVQGLVLVIASAYVVVNAAVDVLYRVVDPRVRDV